MHQGVDIMDTIKITDDIISSKPLYSGFESKIILYKDNLIKLFFDDVMEKKIKKLEILASIDEDIIKPKSIVLDIHDKPIGYSMDYKKDFHESNPKILSKSDKIKFLLLLKEKLDILHKYDIVYGDIRHPNILVNDNLDMYLCDLDSVQIGEYKSNVINMMAYPYIDNVKNIDVTLDNYVYNCYVLKVLLGFSNIDNDVLNYLYDSFYRRWEYDNDFRNIIYNMLNISEENKDKVKMLLKMDKKK